MQLRFVSAGQVSSCAARSRLSDFDPLRMNFSATPIIRTTTKARQDEMCEIVCRAAVGVATKESSPPCVTTSVTKHDEKSWKREYPQVERAIHQYLGRAALFQARISGDVHERTKQVGEGGQTKKRVGEPFEEYINVFLTLTFVSFHITFFLSSHSTLSFRSSIVRTFDVPFA